MLMIMEIDMTRDGLTLMCNTDELVSIDSVFYHDETSTYYKVTHIKISVKGTSVCLASFGDFVNSTAIAKDMLYDQLKYLY